MKIVKKGILPTLKQKKHVYIYIYKIYTITAAPAITTIIIIIVMPCSSVEVCWISWATSSSCCRAWGRPSDDMDAPPLRGVTRPCSCTCFSCTSCANWRFHVWKMRSRCCRLWLGQLTFTQVYINSADKNQDRERPVPKPPRNMRQLWHIQGANLH